jgi:transcriptional regulator EpsA
MMAPKQHGQAGPLPGLPVHNERYGMDSRSLSDAHAQAFLRLVETAPEVHRRSQFFSWTQTHLQVLVPHVLAVCGSYDRRLLRVGFDVFNSSVLPPPLIQVLSGSESSLMNRLVRAWIEGNGRPLAVELGPGAVHALGAELGELGRAGLTSITVHGVARPSRAHEIETFFLFGDQAQAPAKVPDLLHHFELLMPHLHATYVRVRVQENELLNGDRGASTLVVDRAKGPLTRREREIIQWVREGMTNQQIGEVLNISALTVKNHVQNILRKLGASNRAEAVATAISAQVISGEAYRAGVPSAFGPAPDGVREP